MPRTELNELLDRLNTEMTAIDTLDGEARQKLQDLESQIAKILEQTPGDATDDTTLREPIQAAIDDFEKTHPALTMTLGRIMDILNKMGI